MPDNQPTDDPDEREDGIQGCILLRLLGSEQQRPWSVEEIIRDCGDVSQLGVLDAIASLHGAGLIHRHDEFVWATRAAIRGDAVSI